MEVLGGMARRSRATWVRLDRSRVLSPIGGGRWRIVKALTPLGLVVVAVLSGCGNTTTTSRNAKAPSTAAKEEPPVELHLDQGSFSQTGVETTLTGTVTPGATVTVNEHAVAVHAGRWSRLVHLSLGENTLRFEATLAGHKAASESITVTRNQSPAEREAAERAQKEKEEKEKREAREKEEHEESEYKQSAQSIPFAELNKDVERYVGDKVTYEGEIFQIHEEGNEGWMLVNITKGEYEIWSNPVYVTFHQHITGTEKSIITFWGEVKGTKSYETKIGGSNEVPEIDAKYVSG